MIFDENNVVYLKNLASDRAIHFEQNYEERMELNKIKSQELQMDEEEIIK